MKLYEVIVGNIGCVYSGPDESAALQAYHTYVRDSKNQYGRAAGESVTLLEDGDIIKEHEES